MRSELPIGPIAPYQEYGSKYHIDAPGESSFEWDDAKDRINRLKHGVSFAQAQVAFCDPRRVVAEDLDHSGTEPRYFCFGVVAEAA